MTTEVTEAAAPPADDSVRVRTIVLLADWGDYRAGRVLDADADLDSALELEHVAHREATAEERRIGIADGR